MTKRLIFIDMDGTIIHGVYSGALLCRLNGADEALREADLRERRGDIDWQEGDHIRARLMEGLSLKRIEENLRWLPIIKDLPEFIAAVKALGFIPILASAGPQVVAEVLAEKYRFAGYFASEYGVRDGCMTGRINHLVTTQGKADRALMICRERKIDPVDCVAVGDGGSDLRMFSAVGCAIAFNGMPAAQAAARWRVDSGSILDVLPLVEQFCLQSV